ncbi:MAG: hypothetical protein HPY44_11210 [Armatimonadetes bacterium]|nr:hypothetical protein [Armatimonadota bacterium]
MERPPLEDCPHQLALTLLGRQIILATNSPRIHQILRDTYASRIFAPDQTGQRIQFLCHYRPAEGIEAAFWTPRAGYLASRSPDNGSLFHLTRVDAETVVDAGTFGAEDPGADLNDETALELLAIHFQRRVLDHLLREQPSVRLVHAGAVVRDAVGVLILAPTKGGKTTLSVAATIAGMQFMSDDLSAVDLDLGIILPFARATRLRKGTLEAEPEFASLPRSTIVDLRGETRYYVHPEDVRGDALGSETRLTHVVRIVDFGPMPSFSPAKAGMMAGHLVEADCFATGRDALALIWRWGAILDGIECANLVAGPPMETARLLLEYTGCASHGSRRR